MGFRIWEDAGSIVNLSIPLLRLRIIMSGKEKVDAFLYFVGSSKFSINLASNWPPSIKNSENNKVSQLISFK